MHYSNTVRDWSAKHFNVRLNALIIILNYASHSNTPTADLEVYGVANLK
jgi:hypothetical protein